MKIRTKPYSYRQRQTRSSPDLYIYKADVYEHGSTPNCPGCRVVEEGAKYRAKHTDECRERVRLRLEETEAGKRRFQSATDRKLEAITKKAMELEAAINKSKEDKEGTPAAEMDTEEKRQDKEEEE